MSASEQTKAAILKTGYKEVYRYSRYIRQPRQDPRSTAELVHLALDAEDEDTEYEYVYILRDRGTQDVLDIARDLCLRGSIPERVLGATILGLGAAWDQVYASTALTILLGVVDQEQNSDVLYSIVVALGRRSEPQIIAPLIRLQDHPDSEIRYAVVHGLLRLDDDRAISALITLSDDVDSDVRDWATFGLGSMIDLNTPAIRDALYARVDDLDDDTRGEAFVGLARCSDPRVVLPLLAELADRELDDIGSLLTDAVLQAAQQLRDRRLYPVLLRLQGIVGPSDADDWEAALKGCWNKYG